MSAAEPHRLDEIVETAARGLFAAYGLELGDLQRQAVERPPDHDVAASIGFVGRGIRGAALMTARIDVLARAWPQELRESEPSEESVCDWAGELLNQLLGRIKNVLVTYGYPLEQGTPTVVAGSHVHRAQAITAIARRYSFAVGQSSIVVFFDVEPTDAFALSSPDVDAAPASEGEVHLF